MRTLLALFLVGIVATAAAQVRPVAVPPEVKSLLTPSLETWRKLQTDPKCLALGDPQKDYPGYCSQLRDRLDSQLLVLSQNMGATADEALAAVYSFRAAEKPSGRPRPRPHLHVGCPRQHYDKSIQQVPNL